MQPVPVFIALGSNIEPEHHLTRALDLLQSLPGFRLQSISSWYQTRPWGVEDQAAFLNLVIGGETSLLARQLLTATQGIERQLARVRTQTNGPRTIDLDVLLYADQIINESNLTIPHPGLLERDFMLIPLIEIAPDVMYPGLQIPVKDLAHGICYHQIQNKRILGNFRH